MAASLDTRALRAPRQSEVLRPMVRGDAIERAIQGNDNRAGGPVPQPALMVARLAIASPSQADDIRAHRQQNGDAYSDNDQEEFSDFSASRRPQRKAAGMVLCREANAPAFAKGPPSRRALRKSRYDRDQIATP